MIEFNSTRESQGKIDIFIFFISKTFEIPHRNRSWILKASPALGCLNKNQQTTSWLFQFTGLLYDIISSQGLSGIYRQVLIEVTRIYNLFESGSVYNSISITCEHEQGNFFSIHTRKWCCFDARPSHQYETMEKFFVCASWKLGSNRYLTNPSAITYLRMFSASFEYPKVCEIKDNGILLNILPCDSWKLSLDVRNSEK